MLNTTRDGPVTILTLDCPKRRNALNSELVAALGLALQNLESDDGTSAIILAGASPGFCAGSDLKELGSFDIEGICRHESVTAGLARSIAHHSKPIVAAVAGFAIGGGFSLAASCDVVVTTPACRWHMPEVNLGWIPPWGLECLISRCGPVTARRLAWGAEPINGSDAYRLGVADYLTQRNEALEEAIAVARRLAALPACSVAATKRYFVVPVSGMAELRDSEANKMFAENCADEPARATLKKYGLAL